MSGPRTTSEHCREAGVQGILDLLRADEVDMAVETACRDDLALARDHLRPRPDDDRDARLGIGVARLAERGDPAVPEGDVGLEDAGVVDDERVGDDGVDRPLGAGELRLRHAITDRLAAAELYFLAVDRQVAFNLDDQIGVGKPDAVARRRAVHVGISGAGDAGGHQRGSLRAEGLGVRRPPLRP